MALIFRNSSPAREAGQGCQNASKISGRIAPKFEEFPGRRVLEAEEVGVQRLAAKGRNGGLGSLRKLAGLGPKAGPVLGIADEGVAEGSKMHPDLVGAPGLQPALDQAGDRLARGIGVAREHAPVGDGVAAAL